MSECVFLTKATIIECHFPPHPTHKSSYIFLYITYTYIEIYVNTYVIITVNKMFIYGSVIKDSLSDEFIHPSIGPLSATEASLCLQYISCINLRNVSMTELSIYI